jgi:flagellar hook-associated protein 2
MSSAISSVTPVTAAVTPTAAAAASATVTSTGIGSGLDISAIVSSLTTAYGAAQQNQLTNQATSLDSQVSAYGTFTAALDTLQGTLSAIETPSALAGFDATVADKTVATSTADASAVAGTYSLAVANLATSATLTSAAVKGATTIVGTGTLNIAVGTSSMSLTIDSTNDTLTGIAAAINGASNNPGVSASIITTTQGSQLVLSGTTTGASNNIAITETDAGNGLAALVYTDATKATDSMRQTIAAADANFFINDSAATSSSNVVSDAISGVTFTLLGASAADATATTNAKLTPTTLTVSPDTTAATASITAFTTALNGVLSSIQTLTGYNATTQTAGALQGNVTMQAFQNQLETILDTVNSANAGGVTSLSDLGIAADANTGQMDTTSVTLANALTGSLSSVGTLLGGTNGIATQIDTLVTGYTKAGGLLSTINQGLQTGLTNVSTQQTALNALLATYSATLTSQYNAMDAAVAALKMTQTYLNAEFNPSANTTSTASTSNLSTGTTSSS